MVSDSRRRGFQIVDSAVLCQLSKLLNAQPILIAVLEAMRVRMGAESAYSTPSP